VTAPIVLGMEPVNWFFDSASILLTQDITTHGGPRNSAAETRSHLSGEFVSQISAYDSEVKVPRVLGIVPFSWLSKKYSSLGRRCNIRTHRVKSALLLRAIVKVDTNAIA
jgi:hypothetical protein